jgi:MFS family permease
MSTVGALVTLLTPLQLLLTLKVAAVAGDDAAGAFGLITGAGAVFALVANPIAGRISDRTAARFGRRRTWILTASLAGSLALLAQAFTTQVWQVGLVWFLTQALVNFQLAATTALFADQVPVARRGTFSGVIGFAVALGPLVGLGAVSGISNPVAQWGIVGAIAVVLGVGAVILIRDPQHPRPAGQTRLSALDLVKSLWLNPRAHPAFGWAWLVRFLLSCGYASGSYNAFFLMQRLGLPSDRVSGAVLTMSVLTFGMLAVTSAVAGHISDRLRRQKPFVIAAGVVGAGALVLMSTASTLGVTYVATSLVGFGIGMFNAIDNAMCIRLLPSSENVGKDLGIINLANTLPQSVVPFVAPFLLGLGGFPVLYCTLAVVALAGSLAVLRLPEIGREGDPRWAVITRAGVPAPAAAPEPAHQKES